MSEKILNRITSGRWIMSVISAGVFAYVAITEILPKEAVASILTMVFVSYFQKKKEESNGKTV